MAEHQDERAAFEALPPDLVDEFERELRDYVEGNGHWSKVEAARNALRAARAALSAAEKPVVPEGWKLVPVELTPEMIRAAAPFNRYDNIYRAMLAAAPSSPGAEQAKPVEAISEPERWSAYFEGAESVNVCDSEGEAVGEMQFQIDNDSEPGDEIEFCVAPMVSATQMLRKFGAKWIGEDVFERINERLSDEMGAEDWPLDLTDEEQEQLGQQVIEYVCQHAKCQWWTIDAKREQKRTYVAGSNDEDAGITKEGA